MDGFLNLAWLVPVPPFLAFVAIVLFLNRNKTVSAITAISGVVVSLLLGWPIAFTAFFTEHFGEHPHEGELFTIPTGLGELMIGYQVDPANAFMLFMSSFLLVMIFVYASGYMTFPPHLSAAEHREASSQGKDPRYSRFMAYISLFATGMLGLIVSNSLLTFFIFWELMGLCSYLLIGFWYEKRSAQAASVKAFMTTRVGDVIMLVGMMFLYVMTEPSTLQFSTILAADNLHHIAEQNVPGTELSWLALIAVLIFFGTVGKSAQFPLHVWLPDAMEGPTPVSAMIHAATMVSAGVFLLIRMFPLFYVAGEVSPGTMNFVAFIGAFTAIFASTIAVAQWDIKRVLAYSTISQLGFMVAAVGTGAYVAALFHLITHAFFKALLFLGSGSVIHGVEHGLHHVHAHGGHGNGQGNGHGTEGAHKDDHGHGSHASIHWVERPDGRLNPEDPQDMRNMGGLLSRMPRTGWTFIAGGAALAGFPFITAGFWSKDEILASAWYTGSYWVFWTLCAAAFLTAFYTMRQIGLTFLGEPRTEMAQHAPESVPQMTIPLMLITPFALLLGFFGMPKWLAPNFVEGVLEPYIEHLGFHVPHPGFSIVPLGMSLVVALGGLAVGYLIYGKGLAAGQIDPVQRVLGPLWTLFHNKYWVDELYNNTVVALSHGISKFLYWVDDLWIIDPIVDGIGKLGIWLGRFSAAFDRFVVDGIVNTAGWLSGRTGSLLRNTQDGHVQVYLLVLVVSVTVWLLLKAMPIFLTLV
jgi:NADH-quinone oxidoreductase subunit L